MKKLTFLVLALLATPGALASCPEYLDHDFRKLHSKETVNLCQAAAGRPLLIINTASHCGFTPQFKGLEAVHQRFGDRLMVVGFPSNDFKQGAASEASAAEICYVNNGVSFTMLAPGSVRGEDANPVFRELARQSEAPGWNFNKYLVDRDGTVVAHFGSGTTPGSADLTGAIEGLVQGGGD